MLGLLSGRRYQAREKPPYIAMPTVIPPHVRVRMPAWLRQRPPRPPPPPAHVRSKMHSMNWFAERSLRALKSDVRTTAPRGGSPSALTSSLAWSRSVGGLRWWRRDTRRLTAIIPSTQSRVAVPMRSAG